jgi:hypothetical protein
MAELNIESAHALVIGVANYPRVRKLPEAVLNDAKAVHALLIDPERCGYSNQNAKLLIDEEAHSKAILEELGNLSKRCDQNSTAFIYISSHGGSIDSGIYLGEYLLPWDVDASSSQALADSSISGEAFSKALGNIRAGQLIVCLDCCHAGGLGHIKGEGDDSGSTLDEQLPQLKKGFSEAYYKKLKSGTGRAVYSAARANELSWVLTGNHNSLFTKHFLAGLNGAADSVDGVIRIFDLFEYVQPRVTAEQPAQHPQLRFEGESNLPIALYFGGAKGEIGRTDDGFRYDAYLTFSDTEPDYTWVWDKIAPRLEQAGLKVAVSGDVEDPRVARVVSMGRGITQARNTVMVISPASLSDNETIHQSIMTITQNLLHGEYSLVLVMIEPIDRKDFPIWLAPYTPLNLADPNPQRAERAFQKLVRALSEPRPAM